MYTTIQLRKEIYDKIKIKTSKRKINIEIIPCFRRYIIYIAKLAKYMMQEYYCIACFIGNETLATLCKRYSFGFYLFFPRVVLYIPISF